MKSFSYINPTRILFGKGQIAAISKHIPESARVLVTYGGGSIKANGVYDQVMAALTGRSVMEFGGIEPNPRYETMMRAADVARAGKADFILAVGGGSVIDGSKFLAVALPYDGPDPWDLVTGKAKIRGAMSLGAVLTLPATGSESNCGAVITHQGLGAKVPFGHPSVYPVFAVLDPEATRSLPSRQVANGVADAFVHVMEQYLTVPAAGMVQDAYAEALLKTLIAVGPKTLADPDDMDARANLMWAANQALNGLISVGVPQDWSTHMIGHELTALYGLDHARSLTIVLPAMMRVRQEAKRAKLLQYAEHVWGVRGGAEDTRIGAAIERTEAFFRSLCLPVRLSDVHLKADVVAAVEANLIAHGMTALGEDKAVTPDVAKQVLTAAL
ncbi:MAG: iron-containing alcohol dehydrogenase [Rhodospirillaceae bacterium]|nr:iron-containing alcohol dehydrogenase [Rhodospirillaceae bacterium]